VLVPTTSVKVYTLSLISTSGGKPGSTRTASAERTPAPAAAHFGKAEIGSGHRFGRLPVRKTLR
jgi:hypothetical protein